MLSQNVLEQITQMMENQFVANTNKNIFCNTNQLSFHKSTMATLSKLRKYICLLSKEQINYMAYKCQDQFLDEFYKVNQYIYFNEDSQQPLREIEKRHYQRISTFIKMSNPSIYQINHNDNKMAQQYVCAHYSGVFLCKRI